RFHVLPYQRLASGELRALPEAGHAAWLYLEPGGGAMVLGLAQEARSSGGKETRGMTGSSPEMGPAHRQQEAIRARCVHPSGVFVESPQEAVEQSIPERFEQQVRRYPERPAVRSRSRQLTYTELNEAANRVAHAILAKRGPREEPIALLFE